MRYPVTPDGRYFVVRGRLWRCTDPRLDETTKAGHVSALMRARRMVRDATDDAMRADARRDVDAAKVALGERGPVWWEGGAPDYNRHLVVNTPYRSWYEEIDRTEVPIAEPSELSRATDPTR